MNQLTPPFATAATDLNEAEVFKEHFCILNDEIKRLLGTLPPDRGDATYLNPIEDKLKKAFVKFLTSMDYQLALGNFEILLQEKSDAEISEGEKTKRKKYRDDGSINWYHEFIPILMLLTLASQGKDNNGFDIEDLAEHGGIEALITTGLRHDSEEDHKTKEAIWNEQIELLRNLYNNPKYSDGKGLALAKIIVTNVGMISQKRIDGKKEHIRTFTSRMVNDKNSSPIVFMYKQGDIIHNLPTMHGSPKFTAQKRQDICDSREDMYGKRMGYRIGAKERWPDFSNAIDTLDNIMGFVLYPHFRFLENVDLHYKSPSDDSIGVSEYLESALKLSLPVPFNPLHTSLKRMAASVSPEEEEKYARLSKFMEHVIKPDLKKYKEYFPYLFADNDNNQAHYGARALPNNATHAPII